MENDESVTNQDDQQVTESDAGTPETNDGKTDEKKFTQADVDEMIKKRLAKEKDARDREDAKREKERQKQDAINKLEGEEKLKAQFQADLDKANNEREEAQRELRIAKAGIMLSKHGLDSDFASMMAGSSDEETQTNVDKFAKMVKDEASRMSKASLNKGAPPVPNGGTPKSEMDKLRDEIMESAGLHKRK